jgi:negative regulator of genetic competence, sporulation and motility
MFFEIHDRQTLKAILTQGDMENAGFDESVFDCPESQPKQAFSDVLRLGCRKTGFEAGAGQMFIEVYPCGEGCEIRFVRPKTKPARSCVPASFVFGDCDKLIQCCLSANSDILARIEKSTLCLYGGRYELIIWPLDRSERKSLFYMGEFADSMREGELRAAVVVEHGKELISDNALETISEMFGEKKTVNSVNAGNTLFNTEFDTDD